MAGIHVGGLASGMDTQTTIESLMAVKKQPIDQLTKRQTAVNADITAWADVKTCMTDLTTSLDALRSWDTWSGMSAASSAPARVTASATSAAAEGSYELTVSKLAKAHFVASDRAAALSAGATAATDLVAAHVLTAGDTFVVGGQTITIGTSESLNSLSGKINTAAAHMADASKVKASIIDYRLVVTRAQTGSTRIAMQDTGGHPLEALGVLTSSAIFKSELVTAQDAEFTVDGTAVTRSSNTDLTDVIANVALNLLGATDEGEVVTLDLSFDRETARSAILDFIDKYNAAADKLTDAGKTTLSSSTATGATVENLGELHDDSLVHDLYANIRKQATAAEYPYLNPINAAYTYNGLAGACDSLGDIGIGTSGEENTLSVVDQDRFDYMLTHHFDKVEQLLRGVFVPGQGYAHGIASDFAKYSESVTASMLGTIDQHTTILSDQAKSLGDEITKMTNNLTDYEQSLWEQFGAMENAVQKMQSDLQWLQKQLGSS